MSIPNDTLDVKSPIGGSNELSKDDILDLLAPDKETEGEAEGAPEGEGTPDKKPKKPADKPEEDIIDDEEQDDEEEEVDEEPEELNLVTPVRRKEILAKYPNVFKDFPYLEQAYYREQKYTEIFPTIDDASEALDKAGTLDRFETDLMQGDFHKILG